MRIRVSLVPSEEFNAGTAEVGFVNVECGKGTQIVRWLAHEAVRRMEELAGIPTSTPSLVPQAVSDATGIILDPDTVLKEVAKDGDSVLVRFGRGPEAFTTKWRNRPTARPFDWDAMDSKGVAIRPDHDAWLKDLDLYMYGVDDMVEEIHAKTHENARADDVKNVKAVMTEFGGFIQAVFKLYEAKGDGDDGDVDRLTLEQFRMLCRDFAKGLTNEYVDECFNAVLPQNMKGARKGSVSTTADLNGFFVAILKVAAKVFGPETKGGFQELAPRLEHFLKRDAFPVLAPVFEKVHDELRGAVTPEVVSLLKRAKRLMAKTLDSCQLRRTPDTAGHLDVRYLSVHATRWGIVSEDAGEGRDDVVSLEQLTTYVVYVKQLAAAGDVEKFTIQGAPYEVDQGEFERLLVSMAYFTYNAAMATEAKQREEEKKAKEAAAAAAREAEGYEDGEEDEGMDEDGEAAEVTEAEPDGPSITFPEYLRTYLDSIFEKAGALVAIEPPKIEI